MSEVQERIQRHVDALVGTGMEIGVQVAWYQLGDAVRTGNVQLYRVRPDKGFAFATGSESSQTRYRWS